MEFSLAQDDLDRLICTIQSTIVTAADASQAMGDLGAAIDSLVQTGCGECYWRESTGDYRWVFRQAGDRVRVAILWSNGTMTGWEHRFWAEPEVGLFVSQIRTALNQVPVA